MKTRTLIINTITLLCLFTACKSQQYAYPDLPKTYIKFGNGGGFSGGATNYILLENGQMFLTGTLTGKTEELRSISIKKASGFFKKSESPAFLDVEFNYPGNTYFFVEKIDSGATHKVTWGHPDHIPPENIKVLYYELIESIK